METAILAVVIVASVGGATWYLGRAIELAVKSAKPATLSDVAEYIPSSVKSRPALAPIPDSVFDKSDKIAPTGPWRYVPLGRRRAAAEAASLGPHSHAEHVRANNEKVLRGE